MTINDMAVEATAIAGLLKISPKAITDSRGTVREFFRVSAFAEHFPGAPREWAQINLTWTQRGAVRGLHGEAMTKLIGVASGEALGAYVDARRESPSFGTVVTLPLAVGVQMLVPPGVCNGFQATSPEGCEYLYCFDREWQPGMAGVAVNPTDPALAIDWPLPPLLSEKDAAAPNFADIRTAA